MEIFETEAINLPMRNAFTGNYLTANVYTLEGVTFTDGTLRPLSISQLVMAVCLNNAVDYERQIVERMEAMAEDTQILTALSEIEDAIVNGKSYADKTWTIGSESVKGSDILARYCKEEGESSLPTGDDLLERLESVMDKRNTMSQETLIALQSLTSKRDDTYTLISNVLKSIHTVLTGNANNL